MNKVYSENGLWLEELGNGQVRIGISPYGQDEVGEVTFYDPIETERVTKGESFAAIEGAKAVTEIESPVSGPIIDSNRRLLENPEDLNAAEAEKNWFMVVQTEQFDPQAFRAEDRPIED